MKITQEAVEKLNVGEHPGARLCKGLLLDAIEASDKLEARVEQQKQRIDELVKTISNIETVHISVDEIFHKANEKLSDVRFRKYYDNEVEWYYAEDELYILKFPNNTYFFVNARNPREAYCNYWKQLNKIHLLNPPTITKEYK